MPDIPDRIAAIVQFLKNDTNVASMVTRQHGGNAGKPLIFEDDLPDILVAQMPTACIVVQDAPGGGSIQRRSYIEHSDSGVQIKHYGWTFASARNLHTVTTNSLRQLGNRSQGGPSGVVGNTLIHWANPTGSPVPMRDFPLPAHSGSPPDRQHYWPFYVQSWHVYAADIPTS